MTLALDVSGQPAFGQMTGSQSAARNGAVQEELISFAIGDEQYGVDIMAVREIKGWSEISHLPKQPEFVRGVLNTRTEFLSGLLTIEGGMIAMIDIAYLLTAEESEALPEAAA